MSRARQLADSADLSFDDGTLVVDSANNRVGIGITNPQELLHLDSASDGRVARFGSATSDTGGMYVTHNSGNTRSFEVSADNILILDADRSNARGSSRLQFNIDGSEAMRIDSSGNLLVGKTAIGQGTAGFEARATGQTFCTDDGNTPFLVNRLTSDGELIQLNKDGTNVGSIGTEGGDIVIGTGDTAIQFADSLDCIRPFTSSGSSNAGRDNAIDLGRSAQRFKDLYLSGGVYLGGTGAANKLDDYEEGTWTPSWAVGSGQSYTRQHGSYVKIGRQVTVSCFIQTSDMNSQTGDATIAGLPFTASTDTFSTLPRAYGNINGDNNWDTNLSTNNLVSQINGGGTTIVPRFNSGSNTGTIQLQHIGGGGSYFGTTITYETDS
jgi:hypothetical protein